MTYTNFYKKSENYKASQFEVTFITECLGIADQCSIYTLDLNPNVAKTSSPENIPEIPAACANTDVSAARGFMLDTLSGLSQGYDNPLMLDPSFSPMPGDRDFGEVMFQACTDLYRLNEMLTEEINSFSQKALKFEIDENAENTEAILDSMNFITIGAAHCKIRMSVAITLGSICSMRAVCVMIAAYMELMKNHPIYSISLEDRSQDIPHAQVLPKNDPMNDLQTMEVPPIPDMQITPCDNLEISNTKNDLNENNYSDNIIGKPTVILPKQDTAEENSSTLTEEE